MLGIKLPLITAPIIVGLGNVNPEIDVVVEPKLISVEPNVIELFARLLFGISLVLITPVVLL